MCLQAYFVGIDPSEYSLLLQSSRLESFLNSSDFEEHNVHSIEQHWFDACQIIKICCPDRPLLEESIIGGDSIDQNLDDSLRYMSAKKVALIARELNNIEFEQLRVSIASTIEENELNIMHDITALEVELIFRQLQDFYSLCESCGQSLLLFVR